MSALIMATACLAATSCAHNWRNPFRASGPPAPEVLVPGMSLDQVIAAVNQNAVKIQSYQTNNASISVPGMSGVPRLSGNIAAQRPNHLRLQASSLFGPEVDLGSNEELFWLWVRRNEPPAVYFARHDQFVGSAAQQMLPIEPSWLLDALGFSEFAPADYHDGPHPQGDGTFEINSVVNTHSGQITKRTLVDSHGWVLRQHVYDQQGSLLASAVARSHRYYPEAGVSLPQEIDVKMPAAQLALSIDVGTVQLNQPAANPQLWQLPIVAGAPQVDLGAAPSGTAASLGGQLSGADWNAPPPVNYATPLPSLAPPPGALQGVVPQPIYAPATDPRTQRLPAGGVATQSPGKVY